jgi:hypothetical protein
MAKCLTVSNVAEGRTTASITATQAASERHQRSLASLASLPNSLVEATILFSPISKLTATLRPSSCTPLRYSIQAEILARAKYEAYEGQMNSVWAGKVETHRVLRGDPH